MIYPHEEISEQEIKREKEKARQLRQSGWWMRKVQKGECHYCHHHVGKALGNGQNAGFNRELAEGVDGGIRTLVLQGHNLAP